MSYNGLASAWLEIESPCDHFQCQERERCAKRELACAAFVVFVANGRAVHPCTQIKFRDDGDLAPVKRTLLKLSPEPTRELFLLAMRDDDERAIGVECLREVVLESRPPCDGRM